MLLSCYYIKPFNASYGSYTSSSIDPSLQQETFNNGRDPWGRNALRRIPTKQANEKQDQSQTSRYKIQLCKHFMESGECKHGNSCHFAHGYHDLLLTTLQERHDAGLVDANVYRNKPCMIHIATGSW